MDNLTRRILAVLAILIIATIILIYDNPFKTVGGGKRLMKNEEGYLIAPNFRGIHAWINSKPLDINELRGKVVLVDFWTYSCINCIRTLPFLKDWDAKYRDKGLVIIGVHSPEFFFEKKLENVQKAVVDNNIEYAVALDNDFETWRAYNNHFWPHKYLIDKEGNIRYDHVGEGAYKETEERIQELIEELGQDVEVGTTKIENTEYKKQTPELYAGYGFARVNIGNAEGYNPGKTIKYNQTEDFMQDRIYLLGDWFNDRDNLKQTSSYGEINLAFLAKSVNIVADADEQVKIEVLLNKKSLNKKNAGMDIIFESGRSYILVDEPRLYNLVGNENDYGIHLLTIRTKKNFSFFSFTFGS